MKPENLHVAHPFPFPGLNMQNTSNILMIRPTKFAFNNETAVNNSFQSKSKDLSPEKVIEKALQEFDQLVRKLKEEKVDILVIDDTEEPLTSDAVFPNNWISFHEDGCICLYPMFAPSRRLERKDHVLKELDDRFVIKTKLDLTNYENQECFLEGTGSMVLDRTNKIAYAGLSARTSKEVLESFCQKMGYKSVTFSAVDEKKQPIYHTNVMLSVADNYAVVCLDSIEDATERELVEQSLDGSGKTIISIGYKQINSFAGNVLQLRTKEDKTILAMSSEAYNSLNQNQKESIEKFDKIVHSNIPTIEANGGGSVRCMIAEIFLCPKD